MVKTCVNLYRFLFFSNCKYGIQIKKTPKNKKVNKKHFFFTQISKDIGQQNKIWKNNIYSITKNLKN